MQTNLNTQLVAFSLALFFCVRSSGWMWRREYTADCDPPWDPHTCQEWTCPPTWGKRAGWQPKNPNRCSSNLVTKRHPRQGNPGELTAHWAGLKILPHAFNVTPEVKILPTRGCCLLLPAPLCSLHLVPLREKKWRARQHLFRMLPLPSRPYCPLSHSPAKPPRKQEGYSDCT